MKNIILFILIIIMTTACENESKRKQKLIDEEVKAAVESYRNRKIRECMAVIADSANTLVDSLIIVKMTAMDTSAMFGKPVKPIKPVFKSPLDTTPVEPIIPKN
jgi:DNA gyrase/topoisomerase IV subunit B